MRILFLSAWHPYPPDNGSKLRVLHLLRALGRRHEVSLVTFSFGTANRARKRPESLAEQAVDTIAINPYEVNVASPARRFVSRQPVVNRPIPAMRDLVERRLATEQFDVVVASGGMMARYALAAPSATFKQLEEHNSFSRLLHDRQARASSQVQRLRFWLSWQKIRRYERNLFSRFDLVTLVSNEDKAFSERYVHRAEARVEVVPNGVDCEWNKPGLADPLQDRLIYSGALTYSANYEAMRYFLSEIYPLVKAAVPGVSLIITGSTDDVDLDGLALDESVRLTGLVEDIRIEIAQATAVVVPLLEGGGTRLKILEAMALGCPIVSTAKGAEGLDVSPGKELLLADSPEQFVDLTIGLLNDPGQRQRVATAARRLVEKRYDWQPIGEAYTRLLEDSVTSRLRQR